MFCPSAFSHGSAGLLARFNDTPSLGHKPRNRLTRLGAIAPHQPSFGRTGTRHTPVTRHARNIQHALRRPEARTLAAALWAAPLVIHLVRHVGEARLEEC